MATIKLCAPLDEAAVALLDQIAAMKCNKVHLAEIRGILNKNVLELTNEEAIYCDEELKKNGIETWAISSPIGKRDFRIPFVEFQARSQKAVLMAKLFHTDKIRVFSFFDHHNDRIEVFKRLQYIVDIAKKENILVCLENEKGSYGENAKNVLDVLDNVKGIGYVYDSSNFIQVGEKSELTLKECFPRATYVHLKDGIHVGDDAHIYPVGEGEANIPKLISLVDKDITFSIEHHLRFPNLDERYEDIKDSQKFVYRSMREAFDDAVKHARDLLLKAGYKEIKEGEFIK